MTIMLERQPEILGIVNVTEDSFSDGGRYLAPDAALAHARRLAADGADILDLGAAASNPSAKPVSPAEEIRRLEPLVRTLIAEGHQVSVDSFASETQTWALSQGVQTLNDIHGFRDPTIYPALAASSAKLIAMHMVGEGVATRDKGDAATIWDRILRFFEGPPSPRWRELASRARASSSTPAWGCSSAPGREVSLAVLARLAAPQGGRSACPSSFPFPASRSYARSLAASPVRRRHDPRRELWAARTWRRFHPHPRRSRPQGRLNDGCRACPPLAAKGKVKIGPLLLGGGYGSRWRDVAEILRYGWHSRDGEPRAR